mmetsp:Transcript_22747/g.46073  ORF Transcript_22747/g.46073 Transcript_22747/m.46073 type:complete len:249 (-) Transcript_22747:226-972(-)
MCTLAIWKAMPLPGRGNERKMSRRMIHSWSAAGCGACWKLRRASAVALTATCIPSDSHRPIKSSKRAWLSKVSGVTVRAYCTAAACTTAKSTASGCRWLARTAATTALRKASGPAPRKATAKGEIRMAPPLAKEPPSKGKWGGRPVSSGGTPSRIFSSVLFAVGGQPRKASLSRKSSAQLRAACAGSTPPHSTMDEARAKAAVVSSVYMPVLAQCFAVLSFLGGPTGTKLQSRTCTAGRYCPGSPAGT